MSQNTLSSQRIVRDTIKSGGLLLPRYFGDVEVSVLAQGILSHEIMARKVPRLGELVAHLADVMNGGAEQLHRDREQIVAHNIEELDPSGLGEDAHVDCTRGRHGLSLLIPVKGDKADFYHSEKPFRVPDDLGRADDPISKFSYGPGDIAVIRQRLDVVEDDFRVVESHDQRWHTGMAAGQRIVRVCDIVTDIVAAGVL